MRYFIAYAYRKEARHGNLLTSSHGFGSEEILLSNPIQGMGDVRSLEEELCKKHDFSHVAVINWRMFE